MQGELLIVAHPEGIVSPLAAYKERWWVERLFFHSKTKGFRLEATGLTHAKKLEALIIIMAIAMALVIAAAIRSLKNRSIKRKSH